MSDTISEPTADDALQLAEDLRGILCRYIASDTAHPDVINAGLTIAIGDWIHANCRALGTSEPHAVIELMYQLADYLAAREQDRAEAATATATRH